MVNNEIQNCDYLNSKKCYVILTHRRFISECTRNIQIEISFPIHRSVYPCVYREHIPLIVLIFIYNGLSLCVQGTRLGDICISGYLRFIPVCTGNTSAQICWNDSISVYPCVYREHADEPLLSTLAWRFIPVCTGNTPIITYCFIIKIMNTKFLPIFQAIFYQNHYFITLCFYLIN